MNIRRPYTWFGVLALAAAYAVVALLDPFVGQALAQDAHDHAAHAGHGHDEAESAEKAHEDEAHADEEGGHEDHDDEDLIHLSDMDRQDIGITMAIAKPGKLDMHTRLLGKVRINEDLLAHVVPLVSGIATKVNGRVGDQVQKGKVLAVIASKELAESRADLLTARARRDLALSSFGREKKLWQKKISSEQEYLDAKQTLAEAEIGVLAAEHSLHALGISEAQLDQVGNMHDADVLTRFEIRAPLSGTIIAKHITIGEKVGDDTDVFELAGLDTVWVDLNVPQKDLGSILKHQKVTVSASGVDIDDVTGEVGFVSPTISEETRTAVARVVIPNVDGKWRPGLFVTALLSADQLEVAVLVPNEAIQNLAGESVVFIPEDDGFESLEVTTGRSNRTHTEIVAGLRAGQKFIVKGAFELKAKIVTSGLDAHAGHGH